MIRSATYLLPFALTACAPVPVERAMEQCERQVGLSDGIAGQVSVGVGTGGPRTGVSLVITDDIFDPKTPEEFFARCVRAKSGQSPTRPLGVVR